MQNLSPASVIRSLSPSVSEQVEANVIGEDRSDILSISNDIDLSSHVLQILGDDPEKVPENVFTLHAAVTSRWRHILLQGFPKDDATVLFSKFTVPANLPCLVPPKLNIEILSILNKRNLATDATYFELQNQLGKGLCVLGASLNSILYGIENRPGVLKNDLLGTLSDSGRIFAYTFHRISVMRRNLILPLLNLNKTLKDQIRNSPQSEWLFGSDLNHNIKLAKNS